MNKVILVGRLTRNPDVRYSSQDSSMAVARFTLAVDRRFRRDSENTADFISCVAFGKTAEFFERYTSQGTKLCIEGRIQTGSYQKQDGSKVYTTDVVVENAEFAESKAAAGGSQGQPQNQGSFQSQQGSYSQPQQGSFQGQQGSYSQPQQGSFQNQQSSGQYAPQQNNYQQRPMQQQYAAPPAAEAVEEGFMQIPDELNDEGLPFN